MNPGEAIVKLPRSEEATLLALVREEGLEAGLLKCEFTRQQGSGLISRPHGTYIRSASISYDLMLCRFCGNLEGSDNNKDFCPAKLRALQERLRLSEGSSDESERAHSLQSGRSES